MQFAPDATLLPVLLVLSALPLYASYKLITHLRSKRDAAAKLASTGIGRGAPGFLTGSKRVGIPPEIALRIRLGEEVTGEEITAALEKIRLEELAEEERKRKDELLRESVGRVKGDVDSDWLPAGLLQKGGASKGRKRK